MKKLSLFLCLVMILGAVFSFASCAKEEDKKDDASKENSVASTDASADANEESEALPEVTGTLVCGVTEFAKMNEQDADGNWTGFESEFAMEVGKLIGKEVKFQLIDWSQKYNELNSGAIDCIWNGFTANSADDGIKRSDLVDFSYGYMLNQQCIVVKADKVADIKAAADLSGKTACVEGGSAGAAEAEKITDKDKIFETTAQINAFTEVKSGAVDFAVVDIILAQNICGNGDYTDLAIVESVELTSEIYAIGFKKGSDLTAKVNEAILKLEENGFLAELAKKYGFENVLKVDTETKF